jgi:hypothetical protein
MIRALRQAADDLGFPVRISESAEDDLLEQIRRDPTGTGGGEQHTARPQ